jgi:hypothetical protein
MSASAHLSAPAVLIEPSESNLLPDSADTLARVHRSALEREKIRLRTKRLRPNQDATAEFIYGQEPEENIIEIPQFQPLEGRPNESFAALQEWEGLVISVDENFMTAELSDTAQREVTREENAEIPISEVPEAERTRIAPGALFRWAIGYTRKASGGLSRTSQIYFRRAPIDANSITPIRLKYANND